MRIIMIVLTMMILTFQVLGCAHDPMKFQTNGPGLTNSDYQAARVACRGDVKSDGYFLFGPLFILAPVVAAIEGYKYSKRGTIQKCMEARGFKCIENCPVVNLSNGAQPDSSAIPK